MDKLFYLNKILFLGLLTGSNIHCSLSEIIDLMNKRHGVMSN